METTAPASAAALTAAEDKTVAILSYITIIGFIAAIIMHQNHKTQLGAFHLRQMLGMALTATAGAVFAVVPILGWIVWAWRSSVCSSSGFRPPLRDQGSHAAGSPSWRALPEVVRRRVRLTRA